MLMVPDYGRELFNESIKISRGYYNRTLWPEKHPERVEVIIDEIIVSAVFCMPPNDSEGQRDFRMKELYNKVYVVPNNQRIQNIVKSIIRPPSEITQLTKFNGLCVFRDNPNISPPFFQFILEFFPDEKSRHLQIEKDRQFYNENPPVQQTGSCTLI